jgi:hypothetical protein
MKRPSALTRLMGAPLVALLLLAACATVSIEWFAGDAPWWLGVGALFTGLHTLSSVGRVSRYKAWAAKWQAMGEPEQAAARVLPNGGDREVGQKIAPDYRARRHALRIAIAALFALAIPAYVADGNEGSIALGCLWLASCVYLAVAVVRGTMRRGGKRHEQRTAPQKRETENPIVTWVMNRPSSSPSRAEATRALPDYCARLLTR